MLAEREKSRKGFGKNLEKVFSQEVKRYFLKSSNVTAQGHFHEGVMRELCGSFIADDSFKKYFIFISRKANYFKTLFTITSRLIF